MKEELRLNDLLLKYRGSTNNLKFCDLDLLFENYFSDSGQNIMIIKNMKSIPGFDGDNDLDLGSILLGEVPGEIHLLGDPAGDIL